MDNDLNRSVRMLDESLSVHNNFLFGGTPRSHDKSRTNKRSDLTMNLTSQQLFDEVMSGDYHHQPKHSKIDVPLKSFLESNRSITGSILNTTQPWQTTASSLYEEFHEVLHAHCNNNDVFEVIADLARCCSDALQVIQGLKSKVLVNQCDDEDLWLENERNTWRLLLVLYRDRLSWSLNGHEDTSTPYFGTSEKLCILNLFKVDNLLRESQLIIDWLEYSAAERDNEALHFSDSSVGWENTMHQLKAPESIVFQSTKKIVSSLHPDAPQFEKLALHDLDADDEIKLCRKVFQEIRCGKLEAAQKLCTSCGHTWRAALLEGWRLYHNPNLSYDVIPTEAMEMDAACSEETNMTEKDLQVIEGNATRDIWKRIAYNYCQRNDLNAYEKAALASYCGNIHALLSVCKTWEDFLWAYMRVLVDIRVESEIRDSISKKYKELPEEYWDQRMSINDVFKYLEASENANVRFEAKIHHHVIQKYIILDEIPKLMEVVGEWIAQPNVTPQFLRFLAHLVLFLEQICQSYRRDVYEKVLEMYINSLCEMTKTRLVAFYLSKLGVQKQIQIYSSYLEKILENEERREALTFGEESGLNTFLITKQIVENIKNRPHEVGSFGNLQQKITDTDMLKISAIDWLLIYESQILDAVEQTNSLIFIFLTLQKLDGAQLAFNKIPSNALDKILSEGDLSPHVNQIVKEFLCYRAYLDAHEAFNIWFKHFNSKPIPPPILAENVPFTEKVAHQHRESQYQQEVARWKMSTSHLAKNAKTKMYNVLLFPEGGWLNGAKDADYLKSTCVSEIVFLLYSVLHQSENYEECIQLADLIADEKHCLYKIFTKEKLGEVLIKLCESSMELLNEQKDPWGNSTD